MCAGPFPWSSVSPFVRLPVAVMEPAIPQMCDNSKNAETCSAGVGRATAGVPHLPVGISETIRPGSESNSRVLLPIC